MNQKKIGLLLKELRKERNLTQEQLAEHFNISSRSVSRWETGNNLPDLDILIELSSPRCCTPLPLILFLPFPCSCPHSSFLRQAFPGDQLRKDQTVQ